VAIVTGAGTSIGKAVAIGLLEEGYFVVLAGRRSALLEQTVQDAGAHAAHALVVQTDVSDPAAVRALFATTRDTFGRLDLLFNNAGVATRGVPLEELTVEQWKSVVDVNLTGAFLCTQQAFLLMKDQQPQGGRIINNGSISAHPPRPHSAPYTATKHAMTGLTKSSALAGRRFNIACGQIDIGNAATDMTATFATGVLQANGQTATEPRLDVTHVVRAVIYMASLPLGKTVVDQSGLTGNFDVHLAWTTDRNLLPESLLKAVREQLGLDFVSQKRPTDVLIVDRAERPGDR
jgi:NAD(P)-dependent dehydrogenase (short-subunit alcohol dehydrogenase family)